MYIFKLPWLILKKSNRMGKEKTDRDPDLQVSGDGLRFEGQGFQKKRRSGQVSLWSGGPRD